MHSLVKISIASLLFSLAFGLPNKHSVEFYISSQNVVGSPGGGGYFYCFQTGSGLYWPPNLPNYSWKDCHNSSVQSGPAPSWGNEVLVASRDDLWMGSMAWFNIYDLQIYEQMNDGTVNKIAGHFWYANTGIDLAAIGGTACTSGGPADVKLQTANMSVNFFIRVHCVDGPFPITGKTTTTIRTSTSTLKNNSKRTLHFEAATLLISSFLILFAIVN